VIPHFPPNLIIGKQVGEEKEFMTYDDHPLIKVVVTEIQCEYNYSNPTGLFNLSLPHVEFRTSNYKTVSYVEFKRGIANNMKKIQAEVEEE